MESYVGIKIPWNKVREGDPIGLSVNAFQVINKVWGFSLKESIFLIDYEDGAPCFYFLFFFNKSALRETDLKDIKNYIAQAMSELMEINYVCVIS